MQDVAFSSRAVYCDLDGVLCDFEEGVSILFRRPFAEVTKSAMWARLGRTWDFYTHLPWTCDGFELWKALEPLHPAILSGVPDNWGAEAARQKLQWVNREIGTGIPNFTCPKVRKSDYCFTGDILIDDNLKLSEAWEAQGGIFVHHVDTCNTLRQLSSLGILPLPDNQRTSAKWVQSLWQGKWWWARILAFDSFLEGQDPSTADTVSRAEIQFMEDPHMGYRCWVALSLLRWGHCDLRVQELRKAFIDASLSADFTQSAPRTGTDAQEQATKGSRVGPSETGVGAEPSFGTIFQ